MGIGRKRPRGTQRALSPRNPKDSPRSIPKDATSSPNNHAMSSGPGAWCADRRSGIPRGSNTAKSGVVPCRCWNPAGYPLAWVLLTPTGTHGTIVSSKASDNTFLQHLRRYPTKPSHLLRALATAPVPPPATSSMLEQPGSQQLCGRKHSHPEEQVKEEKANEEEEECRREGTGGQREREEEEGGRGARKCCICLPPSM